MVSKPLPLKGLNTRNRKIIPIKGRGSINKGPTSVDNPQTLLAVASERLKSKPGWSPCKTLFRVQGLGLPTLEFRSQVPGSGGPQGILGNLKGEHRVRGPWFRP